MEDLDGSHGCERVQVNIAVSIVNYRTADMVVDCLQTLSAELAVMPGMHVYVVDNASGDGSVDLLRTAVESRGWGHWVSVIAEDKNGGFSFGNNVAIREAFSAEVKPEYVYLLNPDTLMHPGGVEALVRFMEAHKEVGIGGGGMVGLDGEPQGAARRFPSAWSELDSGARLGKLTRLVKNHVVPMALAPQPHACDWVSGASMIIRRAVIESIGLMDEGYFLYYEELDYCYHAKAAGFDVWYIPASVITHFEGASTGVNQRKRRGKYWYDSRRRYFVKTRGVFGLITIDALWAIGRLSFNTRRVLGMGGNFNSVASDPTWFAWDILMGDLTAVLSGSVWRYTKCKKEYAYE